MIQMIQMIQVRQRTRLGLWGVGEDIFDPRVESAIEKAQTPRPSYRFAFHNVVRASVLDERPASIIVRRKK
jgi:hypothetical protein